MGDIVLGRRKFSWRSNEPQKPLWSAKEAQKCVQRPAGVLQQSGHFGGDVQSGGGRSGSLTITGFTTALRTQRTTTGIWQAPPRTPPEAGRGGPTWAYARDVRHLSRAASLVWEVETSMDSASHHDPLAVPHAFARQLPLAHHGEAFRRSCARFSPTSQHGQSRGDPATSVQPHSGEFGTGHGVKPSYPSGGSVRAWYELLLGTLAGRTSESRSCKLASDTTYQHSAHSPRYPSP